MVIRIAMLCLSAGLIGIASDMVHLGKQSVFTKTLITVITCTYAIAVFCIAVTIWGWV